MIRFAWGLQPSHVRYLKSKLVVIIDWGYRGMAYVGVPWKRDDRETVLSCFSVYNCGHLTSSEGPRS